VSETFIIRTQCGLCPVYSVSIKLICMYITYVTDNMFITMKFSLLTFYRPSDGWMLFVPETPIRNFV